LRSSQCCDWFGKKVITN